MNLEKLTDREILIKLFEEVQQLKETSDILSQSINSIPKWISITDVAKDKGMSKEAVRNKLINSGDFEIEKDYRYDGNRLVVSRDILHYIRRQRKAKVSK